jgi:hypothetical protein
VGLGEGLLVGLAEAVLVGPELAVGVAVGMTAALIRVAEDASRLAPACCAAPDRAAEVAAGGGPHTLGAELATAASARVVPGRRPLTTPEETMAALATMPSADDPDRAALMAAPSSPWSSS